MARARTGLAREINRNRGIRADDARHDEVAYKPPSALDAPPPLPGMRQRWIRTQILGQPDPTNVHMKFREGWVPRAADTIPEGFNVPTINHGRYGNVIGIEGMILCHMPVARVKQRNEYYAKKGAAAMDFVNSTLSKAARGDVPIKVDHNTRVAVGEQTIDQDED